MKQSIISGRLPINMNLFNKYKVKLSCKEINTLQVVCALTEEYILEKIMKSKNKEVCRMEALNLATCYAIRNDIEDNKVARNLMENNDMTIAFTAEQTELLIRGLGLYVEDVKSKFTNSKAENFEELCWMITEANIITSKIDVYNKEIKIEEIEEEETELASN